MNADEEKDYRGAAEGTGEGEVMDLSSEGTRLALGRESDHETEEVIDLVGAAENEDETGEGTNCVEGVESEDGREEANEFSEGQENEGGKAEESRSFQETERLLVTAQEISYQREEKRIGSFQGEGGNSGMATSARDWRGVESGNDSMMLDSKS